MEANSWYSIVLFIILLIFSGFFSGAESAYFSLHQADLRKLRDENTKNAGRVLALLKNQKQLLSTILIGNTVVNVSAATVATLFVARTLPHAWMETWGVAVEISVVTLVILVFSEVSPKVFAVRHSLNFARRVSLILSIFVFTLSPITLFITRFIQFLSKVAGVKKEIPFLDESELKTLFDVGVEKGTLAATEREMIHSIFEFRETQVKEVMIPRIDMVCVEKDTSIEEMLRLVKEKGHSRIPVYDEKVDNILGILVVKDLLPFMKDRLNIPPLSELVRDVYYIPESKRIDELLREFQQERTHMAIVVDEYGGTAGLVTLEDVIEEIVGEIRDEYDREKPLIRQLNGNTWMVDAKINIEELNDQLDFNIPTSDEYESLGGFIFDQLRSIPEENAEVIHENIRLIVDSVDGQRILKIKIILDNSDPNEN